jgi:hypothetical protein
MISTKYELNFHFSQIMTFRPKTCRFVFLYFHFRRYICFKGRTRPRSHEEVSRMSRSKSLWGATRNAGIIKFFRTRSTEEEKSEHRRTQDGKTTKMTMIRVTTQDGQAVVLLPWKEFDVQDGVVVIRVALSHCWIGGAESLVTCSSQPLPRFLQLRYLGSRWSSLMSLFPVNATPAHLSVRDFDGD